ncbi:iron ascorbate-dependent oxidoreductase [Aureococcus anophagefferens]|nr:iron ascorbate-dependent oxidoreductase [Aureococcus anophagefferens]
MAALSASQADPEPAVVEDDDDASIADTPDDIAAALEQRGYAYVALDATTQRRVRELFDASRTFHASPDDVKRTCHHARFELKSGGWFRAGEEPVYDASDAVGAASRVEDFCVAAGAQADPASQVWPDDGGALRDAIFAYFDAARGGPSRRVRAALRGRLLATARRKRQRLRTGLDPEEAGDMLAASLAETPSMLRLLRYPAAPGSLSAHTDFEVFTAIHQRAPGLEVRVDGKWRRAGLPDDACAVILAGDALEFWTNGNVRAAAPRPAGARGGAAPLHRPLPRGRDDADLAPWRTSSAPAPCAYVAPGRRGRARRVAGTLTQRLLRRVAAAEANGTAGDRASGA